jgi:hypothetical protein
MNSKDYGVGNKFLIDSEFDANTTCSEGAFDPYAFDDLNGLPESPELRLWVAVLGQLIEDATVPLAKDSKCPNAARVNAAHARAEVFALHGTTAEDFAMVCDLAGYDPTFIRHCVRNAIEREVQVTRDTFLKITLEKPVEDLPD